MRLVTPYVNVADAVTRDPWAMLYGRGGGSIERDAEFFNPHGVTADYTALPKLVGEYGLPAALLFLAFVLTRVPDAHAVADPRASPPALLFFVLSGSLLQPPIVVLCWTADRAVRRRPAEHRPLPGPAGPPVRRRSRRPP